MAEKGAAGGEREAKEAACAPLSLIARAISSGRLHHAYLITGGSQEERESAARQIASLILCHSPIIQPSTKGQKTPAPCGTCSSCTRLARGSHPDYLELAPDGRFIRIEQIRQLQTQLSFRPLMGQARVMILLQAEAMTQEGANAFLKTLEEPPEMNYLLLTARSSALLLDTIVSRCQELRLIGHRPSEGLGAGHEGPGDTDIRAMADRLIGYISGGEEERKRGLFSMVAELSGDMESALCALSAMTEIVRDVMVIKSLSPSGLAAPSLDGTGRVCEKGPFTPYILNRQAADRLYELAEGLNYDSLNGYLNEIQKLRSMLERNVNRQLVMVRLLGFWIGNHRPWKDGLQGHP